MTIQWLASKRVEGLDTDKDTIPVNSLESGYSFTALDTPQEYIWNGVDTWVPIGGAVPPSAVGGWKEVGRTTLGSPSSTIDVSGLTDKRYYMILRDLRATGGTIDHYMRMGNTTIDTGNNYARRSSSNGDTDGTQVSADKITDFFNRDVNPKFSLGYLSNLSSNEKSYTGSIVEQDTAGAGTAPDRRETTAKWANTSSLMDVFQALNDGGTGSYVTGSEVVVLGWDPADTHTTNFWEELASVNGTGSSTTLSSGTITAKKYLWVQAYSNAASQDSAFQFNNDTGTNYATRWSDNGGADSTSTSESRIDLTFGSPSFINMFIINNSANEKLCIHHQMDVATAGAGTAPRRYERVSKWDNTASQITEIDFINQSTSVNFPTDAILKVWGAN